MASVCHAGAQSLHSTFVQDVSWRRVFILRNSGLLSGKVVSVLDQLSTTPWGRTSWRRVVSFTPRPLYSRGKSSLYPLDRRLGGPPVWTTWRNENSCPYRDSELRPLGRPARSQSLSPLHSGLLDRVHMYVDTSISKKNAAAISRVRVNGVDAIMLYRMLRK
jgi:hypothetical protein